MAKQSTYMRIPTHLRPPKKPNKNTKQVVTLMSNDAQKVQEVILGIHVLWGAPALIIVILVLLYQQVGWATFVGLAIMLVYTPVSAKVSKVLVELRRSLMKWTDTRVGLMNEIINGMQMIKVRAGFGVCGWMCTRCVLCVFARLCV
jgi:ABC-type multidrug transport system fused ATPase/permease subunit